MTNKRYGNLAWSFDDIRSGLYPSRKGAMLYGILTYDFSTEV